MAVPIPIFTANSGVSVSSGSFLGTAFPEPFIKLKKMNMLEQVLKEGGAKKDKQSIKKVVNFIKTAENRVQVVDAIRIKLIKKMTSKIC